MIRRLTIALILLMTMIGWTSAQTPMDLSPILSSEHGIRLDIPVNWETLVFESDGVIISQNDDVLLRVYFTNALQQQGYRTLIPEELNLNVAEDNTFENQIPEIIPYNDQFWKVLRHDDGILVSEVYGDDGILLIDVRTDDVDAILDDLLDMIDSLEVFDERITVENYASNRRIITAELLAKGYIREGDVIQTLSSVDFTGEDNHYRPVAQNDIVQNVAVGAVIDLQTSTGDIYETCGIMSRVVSDADDVAVNFLEVGVDSDGDAYIFDRYGSSESDATLNYATVPDMDDEVYVFYKVDAGLANVFMNGELVFSNLLVQERAGHFGLSFVGRTQDASCTISDLWIYVMGSECLVTPADDQDTYFSPIDTEIALGDMVGGEVYAVDSYYLDDNFNPWWQLTSDDRWFDGADATVEGACGSVSYVEDLATN